MFKGKRIAVVVPAYDEEKQVPIVVKTMPSFVDKIIIVDDGSNDRTAAIAKDIVKRNKKVILLIHSKNQGVGAAIASGYKWCRDHKIDVAAVMSGDGQALPSELSKIINPVVTENIDYSKANRLLNKDSFKKTPTNRYIGNAVLSFFTKIASGYWHIMDSQAGYTAINRKMLDLIDWDQMYKRYGQPNDLLVRLNVYSAKVVDVPSEPVYRPDDISGIRIRRVVFTISYILIKMFFWRLWEKYVKRDFHPLVLFYLFGLVLGFMSVILMIRWLFLWPIVGEIPRTTFLAWMFSVITSTQFLSFAMWFDMEHNKNLR